jgi:hypothetical protein
VKNKLTKGSNLLWEGSRIILPEHREGIIKQRINLMKRNKPALDEQKIEEFAYIIQESLLENRTVKVLVFGDFGDIEYKGVVTKVDQQYRKMKLENSDDCEWIKLDDIVDMFFV